MTLCINLSYCPINFAIASLNLIIILSLFSIPLLTHTQSYSLPEYHSHSLKREASPSLNSLTTTVSSSSVGALERRGSLTQLTTDSISPSQSNDLTLLDDSDKIKKLRHYIRLGDERGGGGGGVGGIPASHSFDFGRGASANDLAPPLPPRNLVKKRIPRNSEVATPIVSSM